MIVELTSHDSPPRVDIDISDLPEGTSEIRVLRIVEADILSAQAVRSAGIAPVAGTFTLTDWDAPTGVAATYRVSAVTADGSTSITLDMHANVIPDPGDSRGWLSDPLDASSGIRVVMLTGTDRERVYRRDVDVVYPAGHQLGRARTGTSRRPDVQLQLCCHGDAEVNAVRDLVVNAPTLLFRPPSYMGLPPVIYGVLPEAAETVLGVRSHEKHVHWGGSITPTRGPGRDMRGVHWTYSDVDALGKRYRTLFTAWGLPSGSFGSYRDLLKGV